MLNSVNSKQKDLKGAITHPPRTPSNLPLLYPLILKFGIVYIFAFCVKTAKNTGSTVLKPTHAPTASISKTSPTELHCFRLNPNPDTQRVNEKNK